MHAEVGQARATGGRVIIKRLAWLALRRAHVRREECGCVGKTKLSIEVIHSEMPKSVGGKDLIGIIVGGWQGPGGV